MRNHLRFFKIPVGTLSAPLAKGNFAIRWIPLLLTLTALNAQAQTTYYVNDGSTTGDVYTATTGSDLNPGTSALPFGTLSFAISTASAGDIIYVDAGTYNQNLVVNKAIQLRGANYGTSGCGTRVAESAINSTNTAFTLAANNIIIDGFRISGVTGVSGIGFNGYTITNNLVNVAAAGVVANSIVGGGATVSNNCINLAAQFASSTQTVGIVASQATGATGLMISGNNITGAFYGYVTYNVATTATSYITGGTITGAMQGVFVSNNDPNSLSTSAPTSNLEINQITMSGFTGNYPAAPSINFHAGVYFYGGSTNASHNVSFTMDGLSISGTGKIQQGCAAMYFGNFGVSTLTATASNCTISNNLNRGVQARGLSVVTVNTSTISSNGSDPFGAGGNHGFGVIALNGATINLNNNYISNPATVTAPYTVSALAIANAPGGTINATSNHISNNGNANGRLISNSDGTVNAECNWWGTGAECSIAPLIFGGATNDYSPYLTTDVDGNPAAGYQPSGVCGVNIFSGSTSQVDVLCKGASTGSASVSVSGGTTPYTYAWSNGSSSAAINSLIAGAYSVTVTDAAGCTLAYSVTITEPATALTASSTAGVVLCGGTSATVTVTASGGVSPYSGEGAFIAGVGAYSYSVTDANGCTAATSGTVQYLPVSNANSGLNYATIQAAITAASSGDVINVCAGTYSENLVINGKNGLSILGPNAGLNNANGTRVAEAVVTAATNTPVFTINSNVSSYTIDGFKLVGFDYLNDTNGSIVWASGINTVSNIVNNKIEITSNSTSAKRYIWLGGSSSGLSGSSYISGNISHNSFTALGSGKGFAGITMQQWSQNFNITGNNFAGMKGQRNLLIYGPTATVVLSNNEFFTSDDASNGGSARELINITGVPSSMAGGITIQNNSFSITGTGKAISLASGAGATYSITNNHFGSVAGAAIQHSGSGTISANCNWYGTFLTSQVAAKISGTVTYTPWLVSGTDSDPAMGFQPSAGTCIGGTAVAITETNVDNTCNGASAGSIDIAVSGGKTPYSYAWSNGAVTEDLSGLAAGTYTVTVTDDCGTTATISVVISEPTAVAAVLSSNSPIYAGATLNITSSVTGGTGGYTYSWSGPNGFSSTDANPSLASATIAANGLYTVIVTDGNSCTGSATVSVIVYGTELYVNDNSQIGDVYTTAVGSDTNPGTASAPFATIGKAISVALTGNTIKVDAGNYSENLSVSGKDLVFLGPNAGLNNANGTRVAEAVVTAVGSTSLFAFASNVGSYTIDGFKLVGSDYTSGSPTNQGNIVWASGGSTVTNILNNLIEISSSTTGTKRYIWLGASSAVLSGSSYISGNISHNSFTSLGSGSGFAAITTQQWSQNFNITGNKFAGMKGQRNLLMNGPTATVVISNNEFFTSDDAGARELIRFEAGSPTAMSGGAIIQNNTFSIAGSGKAFSTAAAVNYGANITVTNNDFSNVGGLAINHGGSGTIVANCNWHGTVLTSQVAAKNSGTVTYTPWLVSGTDSSPAMGFQPAAGTCIGGTPVVLAETHVDVNCNGQNNGSINLTVSGGLTPYTYSWSNAASTEDLSSLVAGTYSVTVTDACGTTATISVTINEPAVLTASTSAIPVSCNGGSDGSASVVAGGGNGGNLYSWSNGGLTATISGLTAGTYTVTVTDSKGCSASSSAVVTEPSVLLANASDVDVTCNGAANGSASAAPSGGNGGYSYSWSNGSTTASISGLIPGSYTVTVTDSKFCVATSTVTISEPAVLTASAVAAAPVLSCNNGVTTTATATPAGGTAPYSYSWSNSQTTATATGLAAGTYTVTVTDANACVTSANVTISNPVHTGTNWYVNDGSDAGDTYTTALGSNTNIGTAACPFATINHAISQAGAGDNIFVDAGTYNENVLVTKRLTIDGAGATTIINTSTPSTKAMLVSASGSSALARLVIRNMAFTGPGSSSGTDAISFEPSSAGAFVTVENVSVSGHGQAVHFRSGTMNDAKILNSTLNGNGFGVRVASAVTSMDGLTIDGCTLNNNNSSAISVNPSGTVSNVNTNYTISNTTLANNSTAGVANQHDMSFFGFTGNATLSNVTLTSGNGVSQNSNSYGIVFTRGSGSGPLGAVSLSNVTVQGHVGKGAISFQLYNDISGVSMNNVDVSNCVAPWGQLILSHTDADAFAVGNTTLKSLVLWTTGGADATAAVFKHATSNVILDRNILADCFQMEDQMTHKTDNATLGFARLKAGNVYVTQSSGSIQRGVDAATAGDVENVAAGTYSGLVSINKALTVLGPNASNACGSRALEAIVAPASGVPFSVTADGVTISGFEITAPSSTNAISSGGYSNLTYTYNNIHDIGTTITNAASNAFPVHSILYIVGASASSNLTVSDNCISNINNPGNNSAGNGIGILQSTSVGVLTGANIERNTISSVNSGRGGWGIQINVGSSGYLTSTGKVVDARILNNEISNVSGLWAQGIGMEGNTENAWVKNNKISSISSSKVLTTRANGGYDVQCLKFETNRFVATVTVEDNSFAANTNSNTGGGAVGYAVANYVPATAGVLTLGCNWLGSASYNVLADNVTLTGYIFNKDLCTTNFTPWIVNSTDNDVLTKGFQPVPGSCTGTPAVLSTSVTDVACFGQSNGAVNLTVTGGTAPYTYVWSNGAVTEDISGVVAGTYTVTVTDANSSTATISATVNEPVVLSITPSSVDVTCNGAANGSASVSAAGGNGGYTYLWSNSATVASISGLAPGTYTVTVSDSKGCSASGSVTIAQPAVFTASASVTSNYNGSQVSCNGSSDGAVAVSTAGGNAGMVTYLWSNGSTNAAQSGLAAGTYTVTATDSKGCTAVTSVTITEPAAIVASTTLTGPSITCFGATTQVTVSAVGGTGAYTGTGVFTVGAGTHNYTVTDANGCSSNTSITLTQPPALPTPIISGTFSRCAVGAGTATFTIAPVSDGVNPTSYNWSVPAGFSITSGQGTTTLNVSYTAAAIDATISGQISCTAFTVCTSATGSATVSYSTTLPVTPNSISGPTRLCPGETATYSIAAVYRASSYVWTVPTGITITGGQGTNILNVSVSPAYVGGNFSVAAINACGTGPARIRVTALNLLNAPGTISGLATGLCGSTQTYSIAAIPGASSYNWTVPAGAVINSGNGTTSISVTFGVFTSGSITVSATNLCGTGAIRSMTVTGAPARPGTISGSASVCAGATEAYSVGTVYGANTYNWSVTSGGSVTAGQGTKNGTITWSPSAAASQTVIVTATNACGTSSNRTMAVTVAACPRMSGVAEGVTMTAYPNPATDLAYVEFSGKADQQFNLKLTDLAGRIMLQQGGVSAEGLNKLQLDLANVPSGVYLVVLETSDARETLRLMVE